MYILDKINVLYYLLNHNHKTLNPIPPNLIMARENASKKIIIRPCLGLHYTRATQLIDFLLLK